MTRSRNYSPRAVRYLVEGYQTLRWMKDTDTSGRGLDLLCQLLDVDRAISRLGPLEYQAVLLHGLLGIGLEESARALGTSHPTIHRRYSRALELLVADLNGETDEPA